MGFLEMRVIAGKAKGHQLKVPPSVRPTTSLVRGAIFSILESLTGDWHRVLDLYAGSGALGIEALSRGAGWVDFVEREPKCCVIIKENLEKTGLAPQAHVYCASVKRARSFLDGGYDLIFLDPPYSHPVASAMQEVANSPWVAPGSTLVVSHATRLPLSSSYGPLGLVRERRHGDTCISLYQREDGA